MASISDVVWFFLKTKGRIGRQSYILGNLLTGIMQAFPIYRLLLLPTGAPERQFWIGMFWFFLCIFLWCNIVMAVKRLHDIGKSGLVAFSLFIPIPFISFFVFFLLCIVPSKVDGNHFSGETDCCLD